MGKQPFQNITGVRIDKRTGKPNPPENELDNFHKCSICGQMIDRRDLGQVFYHMEPKHEPIDLDA